MPDEDRREVLDKIVGRQAAVESGPAWPGPAQQRAPLLALGSEAPASAAGSRSVLHARALPVPDTHACHSQGRVCRAALVAYL